MRATFPHFYFCALFWRKPIMVLIKVVFLHFDKKTDEHDKRGFEQFAGVFSRHLLTGGKVKMQDIIL